MPTIFYWFEPCLCPLFSLFLSNVKLLLFYVVCSKRNISLLKLVLYLVLISRDVWFFEINSIALD